MIGSLDTHDFVARNLCAGTEALVASVDYRMGPEHKFPAAVEDSFAVLEWVHSNAAGLGADPKRIGVHGDSAGANLAAVVALMARDAGRPRLRLQSLVYPISDYTMSTPSYDKFASGYGILTREAMVWFQKHYLRSPEDAADWRASPIKAPNLSGATPAIVVTAECDVLHDDGELYAAALREAGVPVEYREYPGMIRAFFGMVPAVDDAMNAQRAVWAAFKRVRDRLGELNIDGDGVTCAQAGFAELDEDGTQDLLAAAWERLRTACVRHAYTGPIGPGSPPATPLAG